MDLTPGAIVAGRYRVDRKVGAGGMGEVWLGEHRTVGSRVALKTLLSAAALNHEVVARFKREAFILGRIRSDHVARVVDFVTDDVYGLVLVMEFVEGDPLSRVLQEKVMSVEDTIDLGVDIASALVDLHHAQIVHRDLKPGNIILQPLAGDQRRAVVVDFGVSRLISSGGEKDEDEEITGITRADMAVGTIEYMAPEQILNSRAVTSASDIYATGAILFRAAAGRHVFGNIASDAELAQKKLMTESAPLTLQRNDKLAQGLIQVVGRALRRKPADRYKSADDLLKDLLPLRDLARVVQLDGDLTTQDQSAAMQAMVNAAAGTSSATSVEGRASQAAEPPAPEPSSSPAAAMVAAPAPRRGVPVGVLLAAVFAALAGGAVLGSGVLKKPMNPASPDATATIASAAIPSAMPSASAALAASAAAPASAAPSASVNPMELDGDDPTLPASTDSSAKKLWGPIPKATAQAGAGSSATAAPAAPTVAPTAKPVAAPTAKPTAAPTAKPVAPAAPPTVNF